eukprot:gene1429-40240_t
MLFTVDPKEVVESDKTSFRFRGYKVDEDVPVVFLRSPEPMYRNYNICAELLPNADWAIAHMPKIDARHQLEYAVGNASTAFDVNIESLQHQPLVVDTATLRSQQVAHHTAGDPVEYFVCVRPDEQAGWNSLESLVTVYQENSTEPFYGYQSCAQFLDAHPEFCGCYFTVGEFDDDDDRGGLVTLRGTGWVSIPDAYPNQNLMRATEKMRFRQGCCRRLMTGDPVLKKNYPVDSIVDVSG